MKGVRYLPEPGGNQLAKAHMRADIRQKAQTNQQEIKQSPQAKKFALCNHSASLNSKEYLMLTNPVDAAKPDQKLAAMCLNYAPDPVVMAVKQAG